MITAFTGEYRWLSNFAACEVKWGELTFPSVEHAYQASKFTDPDLIKRFQVVTASEAKRMGRTKPRFDWDKLAVMEYLLNQKFCDPVLRNKLIETGDAELVEGNWWGDTFWGVCGGVGENHLGKLLMKIRSQLT